MEQHRRRFRLRWLSGLSGLVILSLIGRLAQLAVSGEAWAHASRDNALRTVRVEPPRGTLRDRTGFALADSRPTVDLMVRPAEASAELAMELVEVLGRAGADRLEAALSARGLERHRLHVVERDLEPARLAWLAVRQHRLDGIELVATHARTYPSGTLAPHLVGYLSEVGPADLLRLDPTRYRGGDLTGRLGVERSFEHELRGNTGRTWRIVDALGRPVDEGSGAWHEELTAYIQTERVAAEPGAELVLTIDHRVQAAAQEALQTYAGAAVMVEVETGAILAYTSSTGFDSDELIQGVTSARWSELQKDPLRPMLDRVVGGLYPPASTFKVVTALAALEEGVSPSRKVECRGGARVGRRWFRCWKRGGHGIVDLVGALKGSCDAWFYEVGVELGPEKIADVGRRLGLGSSTGLGINEERAGLLPDARWMKERYNHDWTIGDSASIAIGQGMNLATPLQLALMTATVANGGKRVHPWVVRRIVGADGTTRWLGGTAPAAAGLDPEGLAFVREGMQAVMAAGGTAARSQIEGMPMAGKTGTAQTVSAALKAERPGRETEDHALFIGFAPAESPQVAVAVVVEHVGGGSRFAAPVARAMVEAWGRAEGILPELEGEDP